VTNLLFDYVCIALVDNTDVDESTDQKSIELEYGHLFETPNSEGFAARIRTSACCGGVGERYARRRESD
jgi:hypothetical protein